MQDQKKSNDTLESIENPDSSAYVAENALEYKESHQADENPLTKAEFIPAPEQPAKVKKPKKAKKKEKSIVLPVILLSLSFLSFAFFFLRAFPVNVDTQKKLNSINSTFQNTVRIAVDPRTLYQTNVVGFDDINEQADSMLLLYEMPDGYAMLWMDSKTIKNLSKGDVTTLTGKLMPEISSDMKEQLASTIMTYDELSEAEAQQLASRISCVNMRSNSQNYGIIPAAISAVISGFSLYLILQIKSKKGKKR